MSSSLQFSSGSDQSNLKAMESSARVGVLKGSRPRRIPRQQRRLPVSPLDRHRQMERQVVSNQRMTSAPAASSFRQQFQDRGRISEYDASTSRKTDNTATGTGFSRSPSSRQRAPLEEEKHVGKVVDK